MTKISFKAVLIGGVTDVVGTGMFAIPLMIYVVIRFDLAHMPQDQAQAAIIAAIHGNASLYAAQLLIGVVCSVLGGYVAAWLAKHDELINGLFSSFLCIAIGVYSLASGKSPASLLVQLALLISSPVLGMVGGYLRLAQKRARGEA